MANWQVILLGLIEGLTEFIPVSSTGHLLLAGHFLGFQSPGKTFEVLIQLGAILAILSVYSGKLLKLLTDLPVDPSTRRFVFGVLLAFLPAALVGAGLHKFIKGVLFETPALVRRVLILSRHADDDRGLRLRPLQELVGPEPRCRGWNRLRFWYRLRRGRFRRPVPPRFCQPAR